MLPFSDKSPPYLARLGIDAMPIPYFLINQAIQDECLTLCATSENSGLRLNPPPPNILSFFWPLQG